MEYPPRSAGSGRWCSSICLSSRARKNPSFTRSVIGGADVFINYGAKHAWPSSARPVLSLRALWQFDAIFSPASTLQWWLPGAACCAESCLF